MTYLKLLWDRKSTHSQVEIFSELDVARYEIRKVERFSDGHVQFAGPDGESGDTWLGETPISSIEALSCNPAFTVCPLTAEEFEQVYRSALLSKAA